MSKSIVIVVLLLVAPLITTMQPQQSTTTESSTKLIASTSVNYHAPSKQSEYIKFISGWIKHNIHFAQVNSNWKSDNGEYQGSQLFEAISPARNPFAPPIQPYIINGTTPPSSGDWVINDTTIVENEELIVNGSIYVQNAGTLILRNATIYMNLTSDGEHGIEVYSGGNLTVINSLITAYNITNNYYIKVNNGGKLFIDGSEISYAGDSGIGDFTKMGIFVYTENVTIRNSYVHDTYFGIILYRANHTIVQNNTMENNYDGLNLHITNDTIVQQNTFRNNTYSMLVENSNNGIITDNVIVENFLGITISYSQNCIVMENSMVNNEEYGVSLTGSHYCTIKKNNMTGSKEGVFLTYSSNNTITQNRIADNTRGTHMQFSDNNTITENTFLGCGMSTFKSYNNTVIGNTVNGAPLVYLENTRDITVNNAGQIILIKSENITIRDLQLSNLTNSIYISYSGNITIINTTITKNTQSGISVDTSNEIYIVNSNFTNNNAGVSAFKSSVLTQFSVFFNNTIGLTNQYSGTWVAFSQFLNCTTGIDTYGDNLYVFRSVFMFNENGVVAESSFDNTVLHFNDIYSNTGYGVLNIPTDSEVDARYNYWGGTPENKSTSDALNPEEVWGKINYDNWLTSSIVDTTPPVVWLENMANNSFIKGIVKFTASAYDKRGINRVDFLIDGVKIGSDFSEPFNVLWDSNTVSDGAHTLTLQALDSSNNIGSNTYTIYVDNTPPKIVNITHSVKNNTIEVHVNVTDYAISYVAIKYRIDGGSWNIINASNTYGLWIANIPFNAENLVEYYVEAHDTVENKATSRIHSINLNIYKDEPPEITSVTWTPTQPSIGENITVLVQVSDDKGINKVILSYYDGTWHNATMTYNNTTGIYQYKLTNINTTTIYIKIHATDNSGQTTTSNTQIINLATPQTTSTQQTNQQTQPQPPTIITLILGFAIGTITTTALLLAYQRRKRK